MKASPHRPRLRRALRAHNRRLVVHFYTSSIPKYLQARVVFARSGLQLRHFKTRRDPYTEDYSKPKKEMLTAAIAEILETVGRGSLFFVEDTSLRINALSSAGDFPGLAVKEWFQASDFDSLDRELRQIGNDRACSVFSDIALHVPGLDRPVFFEGSTRGNVATSAPDFAENTAHPWLSPNSFNGWFIPEGSVKPLGAMTLEESWAYDFRIRSLASLLDRLEEYSAALNLPSQSFSRRTLVAAEHQLSLFEEPQATYLIVGKTCAGKTTFGEYAEAKLDWQFIDASNILRGLEDGYKHYPEDSLQLAKRLLDTHGPDIVARTIANLWFDETEGRPLVITGFRTIEEIEFLQSRREPVILVYVDASGRTRYERYLRRSRNGSGAIPSFGEFAERDRAQWSLGLLRVAADFADVRIENEGTLENYHDQIRAVLEGLRHAVPGIAENIQPRHGPEASQLFRCLRHLAAANRPLSTDEIEERTLAEGSRIRHNNANKVLRQVPELARRFEAPGERVRYEVTAAGRAYIRLMESRRTSDTTLRNQHVG